MTFFVLGSMVVIGGILAVTQWGTNLGNFGLALSSAVVGLVLAVIPTVLRLKRRKDNLEGDE